MLVYKSPLSNDVPINLQTLYKISSNKKRFDTFVREHESHISNLVRQECQILEKNFKKRPRGAWKMIKDVIGNEKRRLHIDGSTTKEKLQALKDHFQATYQKHEETDNVKFEVVEGIKIGDEPFSQDELLIACRHIMKGKATGSDEIPIEAYSALLEDVKLNERILMMINAVYATGYMPTTWREILHVPIPKKGDLSMLQNWRAICLTNHIVKLVNYMILNRLQQEIKPKLRNTQFGFRSFRSTTTALAILNEVTQKALRGPQDVTLGFIDFKGAFPSISHEAIAAVLKAFTVPERLSAMILAAYNTPAGYVRTSFGDTELFEITSGVLQGDVLEPFLFILCLDRILNQAMQNSSFGLTLHRSGTKSRGVQEIKITDIDYADDVVFFAPTREILKDMMVALIYEA